LAIYVFSLNALCGTSVFLSREKKEDRGDAEFTSISSTRWHIKWRMGFWSVSPASSAIAVSNPHGFSPLLVEYKAGD